MNSCHVIVAADIGKANWLNGTDTVNTINEAYESNPSVQYIKNNLRDEGSFTFSQVNENDICVELKKLNSKKVTGYDKIPPKLIKLGAECLAGPMAKLVNKSIETSTFPEILKRAEVTQEK